jgi:hypothetical protein
MSLGLDVDEEEADCRQRRPAATRRRINLRLLLYDLPSFALAVENPKIP